MNTTCDCSECLKEKRLQQREERLQKREKRLMTYSDDLRRVDDQLKMIQQSLKFLTDQLRIYQQSLEFLLIEKKKEPARKWIEDFHQKEIEDQGFWMIAKLGSTCKGCPNFINPGDRILHFKDRNYHEECSSKAFSNET